MEDDVFTENGNKTNKVNLLKKKNISIHQSQSFKGLF